MSSHDGPQFASLLSDDPTPIRKNLDELSSLSQIHKISASLTETDKLLAPCDSNSNSATTQPTIDNDDGDTAALPGSYKAIQNNNTDDDKQLSTLLHVGDQPQSVFADLRGDYINVIILTLLYILQGLPIGLSVTMPLVMREKGVGYASQAVFSLVTLPFSCKLLWAPLVDTYYFKSFGKRKSWILPTQIICGLSLLYFAPMIEFWISGDGTSSSSPHSVNVFALSTFFIFLYFLMATQDIAVDSLALTMLRQRNVVWAGTINNIGQYLGMYCTNITYLFLSSPTFCKNWLWFLLSSTTDTTTGEIIYQEQGLINITMLMYICGALFIISTIVVVLFKQETPIHEYDLLHDYVWKLSELRRVTNTFAAPMSAVGLLETDQKKIQQHLENSANLSSSINKRLYPYIISPELDATIETYDQLFTNQVQLERTYAEIQNLSNNIKNVLNFIIPGDSIKQYALLNDVILKERRYIIDLEDSINSSDNESLSLTMLRMKDIICLDNVRLLIFWLLTHRLGVAACDALTELKLFERGLHKEQIAYMSTFTAPLTFLIPIYLTSVISASKRPFILSISSLLPRIILCFIYITFVAMFPALLYYQYNTSIFLCLLCLTVSHHFIALVQMVSGMSFFAMISDPKIAGTFITMLHTAANLGSMFNRLVAMSLVELVSVNACLDKSLNPFNFLSTADKASINDEANYSYDNLYNIHANTINGTQNIQWLYQKELLLNLEHLQQLQLNTTETTALDFTSPLVKSILSMKEENKQEELNTMLFEQIYSTEPTTFQYTLFSLSYGFILSMRTLINKFKLLSTEQQSLLFNPIYMLRSNPDLDTIVKTPLYTCQPTLKQEFEQEYTTRDQHTLQMFEQSILPATLAKTHPDLKIDNFCEAIGGQCTPVVDGYFVQVLTCGILGFIYFAIMYPKLKNLDTLPISSWRSSK